MNKVIIFLQIIVSLLIVSCTSGITDVSEGIINQNIAKADVLTSNCTVMDGGGDVDKKNCLISGSGNILTIKNRDATDYAVVDRSKGTLLKSGSSSVGVPGTVTVNGKVWKHTVGVGASNQLDLLTATLD